ncbi:YehR family lipoprotein [Listeria kieliensis]
MKFLKRGLSLVFVFVLALTVVACGEEAKTKTFELEQSGATMEVTYTYKGDKVLKQTSKNKIPYSAMGVTTKEQAKEKLQATVDQYKGVKGLKETITYGDDAVSETVAIDYEKVDMDKVSGISGMMTDGDTKNGISMEKSEKMLKEKGFKEKE